jgi:hypothetical protein
MKRLVSFLFWSFLFLVVCIGLDQLLVRSEMQLPVLAEVRTFYVDFRTRLLHLAQRLPEDQSLSKGKSVPTRPQKGTPVPPKAAEPLDAPREGKNAPAKTSLSPVSEERLPRYLYVDNEGALFFADRLEDVPPAYRKDAQLLKR